MVGDVDTAGEYFAAITSVDTSGVTNGGDTTFVANVAFNGDTDSAVLDPTQPGFLAPGDVLVIRIVLTIAVDGAFSYDNQFTAQADTSANGVASGIASDLSTTGTDVDQNGLIPGNDGDGDPTNTDAPTILDFPDFDGDGIGDPSDVDDDNDGYPDADEGDLLTDTDADGQPDSRDIDSDNDGIPDNVELQAEGAYVGPTGNDADGDGLDDAYDPDNGGTLLVPANTDGTGDPDFRDTDTDDDGIPDAIEGHDINADGIADTTPTGADADGDGLDDAWDTVVLPAPGNETGSNAPLQNTDGIDARDWRDTDDDGDGLLTSAEGGVANDGDGDGRPDYLDADDLDGDGVPDTLDVDDDGDGIPDATEGGGASDTDADGQPDSLDVDADGDGIVDNIEAQAEGAYTAPTGVDTDGDGLDDAYDTDNGGTIISLANTDGADQPDYLDTDSDNDGIEDAIEGSDADMNGIADVTPVGADADGDGLDDAWDTVVAPGVGNALGSSAPLQNTDGTDARDWRDSDDDNDGVLTSIEGGVGNDADSDGRPDYLDSDDADGDGVPDTIDLDDDNDGLLDTDEGSGDSDGDNRKPDNVDIDSDGDGIGDNVEAQTEGAYVPPSGTDSDGDGLDEVRTTATMEVRHWSSSTPTVWIPLIIWMRISDNDGIN
ncbi:MAG: hypothetical protein R3E84_14540 [Pseudomonadales bacterium]